MGELEMESPLSLTGKRFLRKYTLYVLIKKFITETSHVKPLPARRKESIFPLEDIYPVDDSTFWESVVDNKECFIDIFM
ncbi:MAG: hypothetical protein U9Q76_02430 [candidate division WOR-3 bacterium]|nr:hypothetical protein [candidate division WOR-3 bacterium]